MKFLIFVLGTFLLVQCTHGYVAGKKIDVSSSEETIELDKKGSSEDEATAAALEIIRTGFLEALVVLNSTYKATRTVFQPLIANLDTSENTAKSELTEKLEKVKELFEKTDKINDFDERDIAEFIEEMTKIFGDNLRKTEDPPAADASELEKNFAKAKEALQAAGVKSLTTYSDHIIASAETYWNLLSAKKKDEEKKFYDNLMKIKNEPDAEKRVDSLKIVFEAIIGDSAERKH